MTRLIPDPRRLLFVTLFVAAACTRRVLPTVNPVYMQAPVAPVAQGDSPWVSVIAEGLQLNPYTDPKTRADPYPCARAAYAARENDTPLPRCYYVPVSLQR